MSRLVACNNYVLVRLQEARNIEVFHDILVPSLNKGGRVHGTIESLGPDVREPICVGDTALVPPFPGAHDSGIDLEYQRVRYRLILDYHILGIYRAKEPSCQPSDSASSAPA